MRVQIWGMAWKWFNKDLDKYIDISGCGVGVTSCRTVTNFKPLETVRTLQVCLSKEGGSPVWLTFGGLVEAEQFLLGLKEGIEAYKNNKDYESGTTPLKVVIDPSVLDK